MYESIELSNFEHFKQIMPKLHKIAEERNLGAIEMNHILMDGDLLISIKKVIEQENIDFVVMGTKGATGWFDSIIGTNTGSVILVFPFPF
jgi:hypothetical protein